MMQDMANVVDPDEAERRRRGGRPSLYPWGQWTNGDWWEAQKGSDFRCTVSGFTSSVYYHATRHGMTAETIVRGGTVLFRFHRPRPKETETT